MKTAAPASLDPAADAMTSVSVSTGTGNGDGDGTGGRLRCISSMATRQLIDVLASAYTKRTGWVIHIESVGGVDAARRVQAGEPFDVVFLASAALDKLIASGHVLPMSKRELAHSGVAVAVRAGQTAHDISSEVAVRQAVLAAPSLSYSTGPSGVALVQLFERWGIAQQIQPRITVPPPGVPVGALLARGEVALGFQQFSELIHVEGITVLGPLPPAIQITTTFCAGCCSTSAQAGAVQALLDFMAGPDAADAKRQQGMEPA
jgi:molybdate transport system substrate-binding protein